MSHFRKARQDWRGFIARLLLNAANRIDPDCKIMCDWSKGWIFRRDQTAPIMGEYADYHLAQRAQETPHA